MFAVCFPLTNDSSILKHDLIVLLIATLTSQQPKVISGFALELCRRVFLSA